jgi:hypothetical protein
MQSSCGACLLGVSGEQDGGNWLVAAAAAVPNSSKRDHSHTFDCCRGTSMQFRRCIVSCETMRFCCAQLLYMRSVTCCNHSPRVPLPANMILVAADHMPKQHARIL